MLPDPTIEMVKKWSMALDHWFLVALVSGGPTSSQSIPQQTTSLMPKQQMKRQKGTNGTMTLEGTPPATHLSTPISGMSTIPPTNKT